VAYHHQYYTQTLQGVECDIAGFYGIGGHVIADFLLPRSERQLLHGGAPGGTVEATVGDGFMDMVGKDFPGIVEVGYGACHLEYAVVGAGAHVEASHGIAEYLHALRGEGCVLRQQAGVHLRIAVYARLFAKTARLNLACGYHARPDFGAALPSPGRRQLLEGHRKDFYLEVYTVKQRA
jgi:hypothetical protein